MHAHTVMIMILLVKGDSCYKNAVAICPVPDGIICPVDHVPMCIARI